MQNTVEVIVAQLHLNFFFIPDEEHIDDLSPELSLAISESILASISSEVSP